ncbi:succinylglutamate desuccinylase/aspartoacylase domain-containing protein [Halomicrobium salinisoli]|uniref:succinylglutamate desuccinylase/aspartoacylase domain-containing protein n=1 Tax=Halomicrobium salinisoli TaxID=2878391 RepID=UPI001CF05C7E|nr:succinylglutamate desuccinylase/aspartoacylase family protein [Halomicrobium salinisoli]
MFDGNVSPDVSVVGPGDHDDPDVAVMVSVHGDEFAGPRAVYRFLDDDDPALQRPVKFIVANPPAAVSDLRYLDVDLNRVVPGDPDSEDRERRLAAQIVEEIDDCLTLSIHTTHATPEPLAFLHAGFPDALEAAAALPLDYVVEEGQVLEGVFASRGVVSVETGMARSDAATSNARKIVRAFLRYADALDGEPRGADRETRYYELYETATKPSRDDDYRLLAENFRPVEAGETYAEHGDQRLVAEEDFVPVLMSEHGYPDIFGYKGREVGRSLRAAREAWIDGEG